MMVYIMVGLAVIVTNAVASRLLYKKDRDGYDKLVMDAISIGISIGLFLAYILIVHNYEN
jgi:hypothetical protein